MHTLLDELSHWRIWHGGALPAGSIVCDTDHGNLDLSGMDSPDDIEDQLTEAFHTGEPVERLVAVRGNETSPPTVLDYELADEAEAEAARAIAWNFEDWFDLENVREGRKDLNAAFLAQDAAQALEAERNWLGAAERYRAVADHLKNWTLAGYSSWSWINQAEAAMGEARERAERLEGHAASLRDDRWSTLGTLALLAGGSLLVVGVLAVAL